MTWIPAPPNSLVCSHKIAKFQDKRSAVGSADHGVCAALHRVSAGQLDHLTYAAELVRTVSPHAQ